MYMLVTCKCVNNVKRHIAFQNTYRVNYDPTVHGLLICISLKIMCFASHT